MYKLILFSIIVLSSCNKADYNATFTGFDFKKCGCCWGYEITFVNGKSVKAGKFPESLIDISSRKFPFNANIAFNTNGNCPNVIEIVTFAEVPD